MGSKFTVIADFGLEGPLCGNSKPELCSPENKVLAIIESSKSIDIGIYCGLSFLWNAESPRNLQ